MEKIAVIYYSNNGNTKQMARFIYHTLKLEGHDVELYDVSNFPVTQIKKYQKIALGCPASGKEDLDSGEFYPFLKKIEDSVSKIPCILFGSYGWGKGAFMSRFIRVAEGMGMTVLGSVIANEYPNQEEEDNCISLAKVLANYKI